MKKTKSVITLDEAIDSTLMTAPHGIVFCPNCTSIREVEQLVANTCTKCGVGWVTFDSIDQSTFQSDIQHHLKKIKEDLGKWELEVQPNVIITLWQASKAGGTDRMRLIMAAHTKAETHYFKMWSENKIDAKKKKGPPMPEEVKALLRKRKNPDPVNIEPLMTVSIKRIRSADIHGLRDLYWQVYGANAGANLTADNMRSSLEYAVRELMESKKRPASPEDADIQEAAPVETPKAKEPKPPKEKKAKAAKVPLYEDKAGQEEREAKWAWVKKGSWRADPEHDGGTILDILCTACGAERTIHAADAFQVKLCTSCKKTSKAKA